ncbi:efflux RND transporter periplasmic adaptor subunit [Akkermansia sp.]|uniref:efflux RND transporter periplasmic adaptor subunit n=1 Tax=Akkermansia sp. TaxID=1872421 RepID=UPI003AB05843
MKGFIKIIIVIAVLGGAWFAWEQWKGNEPLQVDYQTEPLTRGDMMITIDATGVTEPDELVDVGAQVSGIIMEFGKDLNGKVVDYSSPVKAGQMLAEIDKLPVQLDVQKAEASKAQAQAGIARARADIQQAKAKHHQAKLDRERAEKLGPGDALSKSSYDQYIADEETARANVAVAEASLKQAEAALKKEMRNMEYTTISSPVDGVVIKRLVNIGQTVVSSMSASSLFYIATDLSKLKIWAAVNEADIGSIKKGQDVIFTVDAHSGRKFKGTVDKIRLDATMTSNVVTYIVDIDVPNPDKLLIPYLTANVQFIVQDIKNSLLASNAALRFRPDPELLTAEQKAAFEEMLPELAAPVQKGEEKKAVIWELRDNVLYPHLVTKGESNGMLTPVKGETLREGMEIVSTAQVLNRSSNSGDGPSASAGGENPFAPKMPPRRKPSTGNTSQAPGGSKGGPPPRP